MELYLHQNGDQVGPYTEDQISSMLASGESSRNIIQFFQSIAGHGPKMFSIIVKLLGCKVHSFGGFPIRNSY